MLFFILRDDVLEEERHVSRLEVTHTHILLS